MGGRSGRRPVSSHTAVDYAIGADVADRAPVDVDIVVFDLQGRAVRTIFHGSRGPGRYRAEWSGTSDAGTRVPPGIYHLRFSAGSQRQSFKLIVMN